MSALAKTQTVLTSRVLSSLGFTQVRIVPSGKASSRRSFEFFENKSVSDEEGEFGSPWPTTAFW